MTRSVPVFVATVLLAAAVARAQFAEGDEGMFAGTGGMLSVDAGTGPPGRLHHKPAGYHTVFPLEPVPNAGRPDFRVSSLLYAQVPAPGGPVEIDAFSIGLDWIVSNPVGETNGPEGRFAAVLFSVTRGTAGSPGTPVGIEAGNGQDGAAGDLFSYEFEGDATTSLLRDVVYRAFDSTHANIRPGAGTGNMTAFDWFAALDDLPEFAGWMPKAPTAYFSVTSASAANVPLLWCGNVPANRSGATVFQTQWRPGSPGSWGRPTVYLAPGDFALSSAGDVDAVAVDTMHHESHYVLFSTASPPVGTARLRFLNRGTGHVATYRFANGGPTVESRLGLGGGDIDALCAIDPGGDELAQGVIAVDTPAPAWWPSTTWPPQGAPSCFVTRVGGSGSLLGFGASGNSSGQHEWWVHYPDPPTGPLLLGPFPTARQPGFRGAPSVFSWPMNAGLRDERVEFGVLEQGAGPTVGSRFVGITEWAERVLTAVAPAAFATAEGGTSGNIWRAGQNRVQCLYDTSHFTAQGIAHPVLLDELEWRQAGGLAGASIHYPAVELWLGYAATDHLSPSASFANNRTASHTLVHSGPVDVLPAWGTTPNRFTIRVPLSTPFLFDPSLGQDLLLEMVIHAAPSPPQGSVMSTGYNAPVHAANTVRSIGSTTSPTGSISPFCPVCRFGFEELPDTARTTSYGTACYEHRASFYEVFAGGAFDLGGWPTNSIRLVPANGGYQVSQGSNGWQPPTGQGLGLVDDDSTTVSLPGVFVTADGLPTNTLVVFSNGFVTPGFAAPTIGTPPTAAELLQGPPRYAPLWADLLPDGATNTANVYTHFLAATNRFYVTWLDVPTYVPGGRVTMQIEIDLTTMAVEYRWRTCRIPSPAMVAWTPGLGARDPGPRDLHELPFATARDLAALRIDAAPRAVLGSTVTYAISNIDPGALLSFATMSLGGVDPGVDLGLFGMPDCRSYLNQAYASTVWLFGSPTAWRTFHVPNDPGLVGVRLDNQAASLLPGANALGAVTSNGLVTQIGVH